MLPGCGGSGGRFFKACVNSVLAGEVSWAWIELACNIPSSVSARPGSQARSTHVESLVLLIKCGACRNISCQAGSAASDDARISSGYRTYRCGILGAARLGNDRHVTRDTTGHQGRTTQNNPRSAHACRAAYNTDTQTVHHTLAGCGGRVQERVVADPHTRQRRKDGYMLYRPRDPPAL